MKLSGDAQLRVSWRAGWDRDLEDALRALPEMESCPHDLYRSLLLVNEPNLKRIALVTRNAQPVAVIGLRRRGWLGFEPITHWLLPGTPFPSLRGEALAALEAANVKVNLSWWRMDTRPAPSPVRFVRTSSTHRMLCTEDFEAFWRSSGQLKSIERSRKRCAKYRYVLNPPGGAEWVIRRWNERWKADDPMKETRARDRVLIAQFLEARHRHLTHVLFDGDEPIGGITQIAHGGAAVASVTYYSPEHRTDGVGVRLMDISFQHARAAGFDSIDLGGGQDYKTRWAPIRGERAEISMWPTMLAPVCRVTEMAQRLPASRMARFGAPRGASRAV